MLILFGFFLLKKISIIFKDKFKDFKKKMTSINYFLIVVVTVYFLLIIYSLIGSSVMTGKYFIQLIPMIIFWVGYNLHKQSKRFFEIFNYHISIIKLYLLLE